MYALPAARSFVILIYAILLYSTSFLPQFFFTHMVVFEDLGRGQNIAM